MYSVYGNSKVACSCLPLCTVIDKLWITKTHHRLLSPKRRWVQYSLRSLLLFVTFVAIAMSCFAVKLKQVKRQRDIVAIIEDTGGWVRYNFHITKFKGPSWIRHLFGDDFFAKS
jgi:hypothetical protein